MDKYIVECLTLLLLVPHLSSQESRPVMTLTPAPYRIPSSYFSMNILFHPANRVPWPSVPIGGWRTSHVNWAELELAKNQWNFDLLDKYAGWSDQHQLPILMSLTYTPPWASSMPAAPTDVQAGNPSGLSGPPTDMEDWRQFVRTVATRYKGRIRTWEIWNEPNRGKSWAGSVDNLVDLTREAYRILKEVDPSCTVVSPAPTEKTGLSFLDSFLAHGGGQYADVIGYHFYVGNDSPEAMVPLIASVKAIMAKNHVANKPLWDTEAGWISKAPASDELKAAYVARAFILQWASGVSRYYWYAWEIQNVPIMLVQRDNATLTAGGVAFATVQRWMTGAVMTRCTRFDDGLWVCELNNQGVTSHIVWNENQDGEFSIPPEWNAHAVNLLNGAKRPISSRAIPVGIQPTLVQ